MENKYLKNYESEIDFEYSVVKDPVIRGREMTVPIKDLRINGEFFAQCNLIFKGVKKSERTLWEYIGDPKSGQGFKPKRTVIDVPPADIDIEAKLYGIEGVFESSEGWSAWVHWEIESVNCVIEPQL